MNLYLISQKTNRGYDTYDSAVVAAESMLDAVMMHPDGEEKDSKWFCLTWCGPEDVDIKLIGVASAGARKGVVCASFNAG